MRELFCGIDEAGRGPVIGPLVIGCVVVDKEGRKKLKELKVRDSKKLSPKKRSELEPLIKETALEWYTIKITPQEIDTLRRKHSLNLIEAMKTAEVLLSLNCVPTKVFVDAADTEAEEYRHKIIQCLTSGNEEFMIPEIIAEHKADDRYVEVSAASILAKVERDREIKKLKETYGEIGSGYPSDEVTMSFLKEITRSGCDIPSCVRRSWNTLNKTKQTTLEEY